jgi:hypothetical protein
MRRAGRATLKESASNQQTRSIIQHKNLAKKLMAQTVNNLIAEIHSDLGSAVAAGSWNAGTVNPNAPASCGVDGATDIGTLTNQQLTNVVTFAVKSKWVSETGAAAGLKIKGAEMVKSVTGLEPS